ncbi:MAG: gamma-glutamyltransferase [Rhodospirillales bacterium]
MRGVELALARWGTLSLPQALAPAIAAAEGGIVVDRRLAASAANARLQVECGHGAWDEARRVFRPGADPSGCGRPPAVGETIAQPALARTFRLIAARGSAAFYDCNDSSGIARALVAAQRASRQELGNRGAGRMSCADLAAYRPVVREPLEATYRGWLLRVPPPPSSGGLALIQMLKMLERFPLGDSEAGFERGSFATLSVMQEAMRLAFADRALWMGDTDAVPGLPVAALIGDRYLARRSATCPPQDTAAAVEAYCITPGARIADVRAGDPLSPPDTDGTAVTAAPSPSGGAGAAEGRETTHFTIVDREGNAVSWTNTIEAPWGSGLMVPGFGFLLNNELTDFNLSPTRHGNPGEADWNPGANDVAPGKRPRSSMAPVIVFAPGSGKLRPVAAYGSPGGSTIINTVLGVTLDLIDFRMSVRDAVETPRLSLTSAAEEATTAIEPGFEADVLQRLRAIGYRIRDPRKISARFRRWSSIRGRSLADGFADPRRDGRGIGIPAN